MCPMCFYGGYLTLDLDRCVLNIVWVSYHAGDLRGTQPERCLREPLPPCEEQARRRVRRRLLGHAKLFREGKVSMMHNTGHTSEAG